MTTTARPIFILAAILMLLLLAVPGAMAGQGRTETVSNNETIAVGAGRTQTGSPAQGGSESGKSYVLTSVSHPASNGATTGTFTITFQGQ